ncbi:MAG: polyphosphate kinase 1 [Pseudomonadales bacterium]|nr:polyphosphate kinase 1 [Pseudomonadales bacterium]
MTEKEIPYVEKELSWLSFNQRVLQEAADSSVPIVERVRFLGIFSNNLDEFFRVRVADVKRRLIITSESGREEVARHLLAKIQNKVLQLQEQFDEIYIDVIRGLAKHKIFLISEYQLSEEHGQWLRNYFRNKLLRYITPITISDNIDLAKTLKEDLTYLVTEMVGTDGIRYAAIEVPTEDAPRFIQLPKVKGNKRKNIIMLDNIIRYCADEIYRPFFDYDYCHSFSMKMTCDAEYGLTDDIDLSLVEQMSEGLKQRLTAAPVRLVYDREMPAEMVEMLKGRLGITALDSIVPGGRYHNFRDFIGFPNVGRDYLEYPKMSALNAAPFDFATNVFTALSKQDLLLYYPYFKFKYLTEFLRQSALDPAVEEIKISIYRLASRSRVIKSLIDAAENGKKVTVFIELAARFDEEANIEWAKRLTDSNVKVEFGIPSLKCHAKIIMVSRKEQGVLRRYVHVGTGNFNEKTAKVYTDFSLFTCNPEIAGEVASVFDFMVHSYRAYTFKHLWVSPVNVRDKLYALIDYEIEQAKAGNKARISIKINNIDDHEVIKRLYEASSAGVKIRIIVRGMCSLVPGVEGVSENISVISIVGRFLEHPRYFIFHHAGNQQVYISSADLMTRNLDRRVEVGCPILDETLKNQIVDIFNLQWSDNTKARIIDREQANNYKSRGNKRKVRSQIEIYDYLKEWNKLLAKSNEEHPAG